MGFASGFVTGLAKSVDDQLKKDMLRTQTRMDGMEQYRVTRKRADNERKAKEGDDLAELLTSLAVFTDGDLDTIFSEDQEYDFTITFLDHTSPLNSAGKPSNKAIELEVTKAKCQSQSFSQNIGNNMQVEGSFTFECTPFTGFKFSGIASN